MSECEYECKEVRSSGYLASYLTSVLPVFFIGRDHALILVEVEEGIICISVSISVRGFRSRGKLALPYV